MKLIANIKTYFNFSQVERNGILVLLTVLIFIIIAIKIVPKQSSGMTATQLLQFQKEVDSLFTSDTFPSVQHKFVQKTSFIRDEKVKPQSVLLELNTCDSAELTKLPGIGPIFASRIIKYRNLLGGFYHVNQLKEVYGIKEENLTKAISMVYVNVSLIKQINFDSLDFKQVFRHPYIGKDKAWQIVNFKKKYRIDTNLAEEIDKANIFDSAQWGKLKPYVLLKKLH